MSRWTVLNEIVAEADRGTTKHGPFNHPDGTWNGGMRLHRRQQSQDSCDRAQREGTLTCAKILEEEVDEVFAEESKPHLRAELLQVAAVALKWIEKLDREKTMDYKVTIENGCPLVSCTRPFCKGEQEHDIGGPVTERK